MAVTTTNLGVITAYGDAVAAGYTGTKAEWQALMASYATVGQQAVDAKNAAVAAKDTAVSKATEATTAANTATTKANEASASAQSIAQSAAQIQENTDDIDQLKSKITDVNDNFEKVSSINLFDGDFDESGYINPSTGADVSATGMKRTSKFYAIKDLEATTIYGVLTGETPTFTLVFYDSEKNQTGYYGKSRTATAFNSAIPANTRYFRAYTNNEYDGDSCISTTYTPVFVPQSTVVYLTAELEGESVGLSNLDNTIANVDNLVDDIAEKTYINYANGNTATADAYRASDFISVNPNTEYYFGVCNDAGAPSTEVLALTVVFYDASKAFISNTGAYLSGNTTTNCVSINGMQKVTAPADAAFCRLCANDNSARKHWFFGTNIANFVYAKNKAIQQNNLPHKNALSGKIVACFGDSIIGKTRDYTSTPAYISEATGATVYNFGFGGCRMSVHTGEWDKCSMYRIADDIYNDDFTNLVSAINTGWSGMPGYFRNTASWLANCDFSSVDAIVISYGTNDYREPTSVLDNTNDKFDTSTVCGALRYSIKQILSKYPDIQILVTCPIFRTFFADGTTTPSEYSDTKDWGSGTLLNYAEAYKKACEDMNVPFLDLYHETSFNPYTRLHFYPSDDGTHPDEYGRKRLGVLIGRKLSALV